MSFFGMNKFSANFFRFPFAFPSLIRTIAICDGEGTLARIFSNTFGKSLTYSYLCNVIYPKNFEQKLGFDEIRRLLKERCLSTLGKEKGDEMTFSADCHDVNEWLTQVREFRRLQEEKDDFPIQYFFDVREAITRIRMEGTHLEEDEVWDLRRSLETIANIAR